MTERCCVRCWRDLEFSIFDISPKICCFKCCNAFKTRCGLYRGVTANCAKKKHGCSKGDLKFLNYTTVIDWHNRGELISLYLEAEVDFLAHLRDTHPNKTAKEALRIFKQEAMQNRQNEVEEALGVKVEAIAPIYQSLILGDYLTKPGGTKMQISDVVGNYERIAAVNDVFDNEPGYRSCAMYFSSGRWPYGALGGTQNA